MGDRLLAIHSGALGDVVLFAQFLLAARNPGEPLALVAGGELARLLGELGVIDEPLDFAALPMHDLFTPCGPAPDGPLARRLGRCGRLISCFGANDAAAQAGLAELTRAVTSLFLPVRPAPADRRHLLDVWAGQALLAPAALDRLARPPAWRVPPALLESGRQALREVGGSGEDAYTVLHVGSGSPAKCWPLERFESLAAAVAAPAVFVLGHVEVERLGDRVVAGLAGRWPTLVCPSLAVLAGVLAGAARFVGNDSGAAHLAAAVGAPTLVLFGPSDPAHFSPRGRCVRALRWPNLADLPVAQVASLLPGQIV